jgi:hypothetical protein
MLTNGAAALVLFATAAHADTMQNCSAAWNSMAAADKAKTTYKLYSTMCLKSTYTVPASPGAMMSAAPPPAGATGKCKDGTYTMATTHSGACSHHGGVDSWLPGH